MKKIIHFILFFSLISCDIPKKIVVKNYSKKPAYFSWSINPAHSEAYSFSPFLGDFKYNDDSTGKILKFEFNEKKVKEALIFIGGFGGWSDDSIDFVVNNVNFIEIRGVKTNLIIYNKQEIRKFLLERKKTYTIKIRIE